MAGIEYWLWLSAESGLSVRAKAALLQTFGDPETAWNSRPGSFRGIRGIGKKDAELLEKRDISRTSQILRACAKQGIGIYTLEDNEYPQRLKQIYSPPPVIFIKGSLPDVDSTAAIAVIGTRKTDEAGLAAGVTLAAELSICGGIVVSGLTNGIDAAAAEGTLLAKGKCIGVLGTPHEAEHGDLARRVAEQGAVISEYPPGTSQQRNFFRDRNRITAGLAVGVAVVRAPKKSNTRLFALEAIEQGKDVFAIPGDEDDPLFAGNNTLLQEGAHPIRCGWDVLREYTAVYPGKLTHNVYVPAEEAKRLPKASRASAIKDRDTSAQQNRSEQCRPVPALSRVQKQIMDAIGRKVIPVDEVIAETGLNTAVVLSQLTILEIRGLICRQPGGKLSCK